MSPSETFRLRYFVRGLDATEDVIRAWGRAHGPSGLPKGWVRERYMEMLAEDPDAALGVLDGEKVPRPEAVEEPPYRVRDVAATGLRTKQVRWAWGGRLPASTVAILEGDPDVGKSTMACTLGAAFTRAHELPDFHPDALHAFTGPVNVGYVSAEDAPAVTLLPRFLAAGGDPRALFFYDRIDVRGLNGEAEVAELLALPRHHDALRAWIEERELKVVVVDVLSAFTDEKVDSHNDASVRRMLTPLKEVAEDTGCLILVLRHLVKGKGVKAIYAGQGSIGYGAAARSVLTAARHPDDDGSFVLAVTKGNLAPVDWRSTLSYRLRSEPFHFDDSTTGTVARLEWGGTVDLSADDALAHPGDAEDRSARDEAAEWLTDLLGAGEVGAGVVKRKADQAGHSWATVRRAKAALGAKSRKVGAPGQDGEWVWYLPEDAHEPPKMPRDETLSTFADVEHLRQNLAATVIDEPGEDS